MEPIRNVLEILKTRLNEHMRNLSSRMDDWVTLTSIVNHDGTTNRDAEGKVVLCLYNIEREHIVSTYNPTVGGDNRYAVVQPPIYVVLHVMFMANFAGSRYPEGLSAISQTISFFQQNPVLTHSVFPDLDRRVDKITIDMENLSPVDVNYIMGMIGTRYLPSVFYKLRMIPYASDAMSAVAYPARRGSVTGDPSGGGDQ